VTATFRDPVNGLCFWQSSEPRPQLSTHLFYHFSTADFAASYGHFLHNETRFE